MEQEEETNSNSSNSSNMRNVVCMRRILENRKETQERFHDYVFSDIALFIHGAPEPLYLHKKVLETASSPEQPCVLLTRLSRYWNKDTIAAPGQKAHIILDQHDVDELCQGMWIYIWIYFGLLYGVMNQFGIDTKGRQVHLKERKEPTLSQDCWMTLIHMADYWLHTTFYQELLGHVIVNTEIEEAYVPFLSELMVKEHLKYKVICVAIAHSQDIHAVLPLDANYIRILMFAFRGGCDIITLPCRYKKDILLKLLDCETNLYVRACEPKEGQPMRSLHELFIPFCFEGDMDGKALLQLDPCKTPKEKIALQSILECVRYQLLSRDLEICRQRLNYIWKTVFPNLPALVEHGMVLFGSSIPLCMTSYHLHYWIAETCLFYPDADLDVFLTDPDLLPYILSYLKRTHGYVWKQQHHNDDDHHHQHDTSFTEISPGCPVKICSTILVPIHPFVNRGQLRIKFYCESFIGREMRMSLEHAGIMFPFITLERWLLCAPLCPTRAYYIPFNHTLLALPSALLSWTTHYMREYRSQPDDTSTDIRLTGNICKTKPGVLITKWIQRGFGVVIIPPTHKTYEHREVFCNEIRNTSHCQAVRNPKNNLITLIDHHTCALFQKPTFETCELYRKVTWDKELCWQQFLTESSDHNGKKMNLVSRYHAECSL